MPTSTSESLPSYQPHPRLPSADVLIQQKRYYDAVMELRARYLQEAAQKYDGNKRMLTAADHQEATDKAKASAAEERRSFFNGREKESEKKTELPNFTPFVVIMGLYIRRKDVYFEEGCQKNYYSYYEQCVNGGMPPHDCQIRAQNKYNSCELAPLNNFIKGVLSCMWYGFWAFVVGLASALLMVCLKGGLEAGSGSIREMRRKREDSEALVGT